MKKMLFLLMMLVFIMSCGKGGGSSKIFTLNLSDEPKSIDPQISTDILGGTVNDLLMEGLTRKGKMEHLNQDLLKAGKNQKMD